MSSLVCPLLLFDLLSLEPVLGQFMLQKLSLTGKVSLPLFAMPRAAVQCCLLPALCWLLVSVLCLGTHHGNGKGVYPFLIGKSHFLFGAGAEDNFPIMQHEAPNTSSVGSRQLLHAQSWQPSSSLFNKLPSGLRGSHLHCLVAFLWAVSEGRSPFLVVLSIVHSLPGLGLLPFPPLPAVKDAKCFKFSAEW